MLTPWDSASCPYPPPQSSGPTVSVPAYPLFPTYSSRAANLDKDDLDKVTKGQKCMWKEWPGVWNGRAGWRHTQQINDPWGQTHNCGRSGRSWYPMKRVWALWWKQRSAVVCWKLYHLRLDWRKMQFSRTNYNETNTSVITDLLLTQPRSTRFPHCHVSFLAHITLMVVSSMIWVWCPFTISLGHLYLVAVTLSY